MIRATWLAVGIVAIAAALRFGPIVSGSGLVPIPDEQQVAATLSRIELAAPRPLVVLYGGGYVYPLAAFVESWGLLAGFPMRGENAAADRVTLAARSFSALLATATVALTFVAGRRLAGRACGLLAAALVAVLPLAVREAQFAKADSAAAFAAACLLLLLVREWRSRTRGVIAIAVAAAFAASTKLSLGVLPAAAYALHRLLRRGDRRLDRRALLFGSAAAGATLLLLNPYWVLSPALSWTLAKAIAPSFATTSWLPGGDSVPGPFVYHVTTSLRFGCGLAVTALTLPAVALGLLRAGPPRAIAILVLGHFAVLLSSPMVIARFFLTCVPALAVLVAYFALWLADRPRRVGR